MRRHQVSLTAGTILYNTRTSLTAWFWAVYLMTTEKRGASVQFLQRQLALRRNETAWMMLHKFCRAMVNLAREPLRGDVEVDDTWAGGIQGGLRRSRQLKSRKAALVLAAAEKRDSATGPKSFTGLQEAGFKHVFRTQPLPGELRKDAKSVVSLVGRAIGNLQQWLIVTYHGVSREKCWVHLDGFVFRHNRSRVPMAAFQTLLSLGAGCKPTHYQQIPGAADIAKPNRNLLGVAETTG